MSKAHKKARVNQAKIEHLRKALETLEAAAAAEEPTPKKKKRGRKKFLLLAIVGALVVSEDLRGKVLDALFGKEEEFQYTPPAPAPTTPVSAA